MPPIRVLCVEDHSIVREGIGLLINLQSDLQVVGSVASGEEAVATFDTCRPDVTLMDLRLTGMTGVEAIRAIRGNHPDARIIVLTMYRGEEDIRSAIEAGAVTYLLKDSLSDDLLRVIREVHEGCQTIPRDVERALAERSGHPTLTPREIEVMEFVSRGMRNREIAASLGISVETVQVHVKRVLLKLEVADRTAAVNVALRRGIIHIP
jgi:DNA-binding NarL/FixJ family response regulator